MQKDSLGGDAQFALKHADEIDQPLLLGGGELPAVSVTHQADADGVTIEIIPLRTSRVDTGELLQPANADKDAAVVSTPAVANDELVAQALVSASDVLDGESVAAAVHRSGVIDNDVSPALVIQRRLGLPDSFELAAAPAAAGEADDGRGAGDERGILDPGEDGSDRSHGKEKACPDDRRSREAQPALRTGLCAGICQLKHRIGRVPQEGQKNYSSLPRGAH